jgi:hypothetical protein
MAATMIPLNTRYRSLLAGSLANGGKLQPLSAQYTASTTGLPANYGFADLAGYEDKRRNDFANQIESELAQRRATLSNSLNQQGKSFFDLANPGILEDLNNRGLFRSPTAVNSAQADALKEIALSNQSYLNDFDTQATGAKLQAQQDALDSSTDLLRGDLESRLSQANSSQEEQLARDLAKVQGRNSLYGSLIGAGGSLGSSLLMSRLMGGGSLFGGGAGAAGAGGAGASGVGGFGAFGTGGALHALGPVAGVGAALAIRNGMKQGTFGNTGNAVINAAQPFFAPDKAIKSVANVVSNPVKSIKKVFCFDGETPIRMADGTDKAIQDVCLNDFTHGGWVESISISMTSDGTLRNYLGTLVTASHAVKEKGSWIRVGDSKYAVPVSGAAVVYSLVTTDHRIHVGDVTFADQHETDNYETLDMNESLEALNKEDGLVGVN